MPDERRMLTREDVEAARALSNALSGPKEGWKYIHTSGRRHYFRDGLSLCKKWGAIAQNGLTAEPDSSQDNCAPCARLRAQKDLLAGHTCVRGPDLLPSASDRDDFGSNLAASALVYSGDAHARARGVVYPLVAIEAGSIVVTTPDGRIRMRFSVRNARAFAEDLRRAAVKLAADTVEARNAR